SPIAFTSAPSTSGNFRLQPCSPAINTGTPDTTGLHLPLTDIDGSPRIYGQRIDPGAYEHHPAPVDFYVDGLNGNDVNSGISWTSSLKTLAHALTRAQSAGCYYSHAKI